MAAVVRAHPHLQESGQEDLLFRLVEGKDRDGQEVTFLARARTAESISLWLRERKSCIMVWRRESAATNYILEVL